MEDPPLPQKNNNRRAKRRGNVNKKKVKAPSTKSETLVTSEEEVKNSDSTSNASVISDKKEINGVSKVAIVKAKQVKNKDHKTKIKTKESKKESEEGSDISKTSDATTTTTAAAAAAASENKIDNENIIEKESQKLDIAEAKSSKPLPKRERKISKKSKKNTASGSGKNTKKSSALSGPLIPAAPNQSNKYMLPEAKTTTTPTSSSNPPKKGVVVPNAPAGNSTTTSSSTKRMPVVKKKKKGKGKSSIEKTRSATSISTNSGGHAQKDKETFTAATGGKYKYSLRITVPPELESWVASDSAKEVAQFVVDKSGIAKLDYDDSRPGKGVFLLYSNQDNLKRAKALLDLHIANQVQLYRASSNCTKLERNLYNKNREIELGLRVEFPVPSECVGLVIGKAGAHINRVKEETGVFRILVENDTDPCMVRIIGDNVEKVAEARSRLEYTYKILQLAPSQQVWLKQGNSGMGINEIRRTSGIVNIQLDHEAGSIKLTGRKEEVESAEMLIDAQIDYMEQFTEIKEKEKEIRKNLSVQENKFGAPNYQKFSSRSNKDKVNVIKGTTTTNNTTNKTSGSSI